MIELNNEILVLTTTRCNYRCRHCFLSCTNQGDDMTLKQGRALIDEIARMPMPDKKVLFMGGEPTLRFNLLKDLIRRSAGHGIVTELATNGWWHDRAEEYSEELAAAGLDRVYISCDKYHLKFIKWENIKKVYHSLEKIGIDVGLAWTLSYPLPLLSPALIVTDMLKYMSSEDVQRYMINAPGGKLQSLNYYGRAISLGCGQELGIKTWSVPLVVDLAVLPGNVFSLNCPMLSPWSRRSYRDGQLLSTAVSWEMSLYSDIRSNPERVINTCSECREYIADITKEGGE